MFLHVLGIAVRSGKDKAIQQRNKEQKNHDTVFINLEQSEDIQDSIPGTPPSKKFKSMFFSAMSNKKSKMPDKEHSKTIILVEDSDVDSD